MCGWVETNGGLRMVGRSDRPAREMVEVQKDACDIDIQERLDPRRR